MRLRSLADVYRQIEACRGNLVPVDVPIDAEEVDSSGRPSRDRQPTND